MSCRIQEKAIRNGDYLYINSILGVVDRDSDIWGNNLKYYLNKFIFKDKLNLAADVFMDAGSYLKYEPEYTGNGSMTFYSLVKMLNALKEEDPIKYFRDRIKYCIYNYEQYTLLMDFFNQKKKEINMCQIEDIFKNEMINSINILEMIATVVIGYQEEIDLQYRLKAFKNAYDSIDSIVKDLERLWLVRNKYSRLGQTVNNFNKVKEFIKISIEYYQGGKDETQN